MLNSVFTLFVNSSPGAEYNRKVTLEIGNMGKLQTGNFKLVSLTPFLSS